MTRITAPSFKRLPPEGPLPMALHQGIQSGLDIGRWNFPLIQEGDMMRSAPVFRQAQNWYGRRDGKPRPDRIRGLSERRGNHAGSVQEGRPIRSSSASSTSSRTNSTPIASPKTSTISRAAFACRAAWGSETRTSPANIDSRDCHNILFLKHYMTMKRCRPLGWKCFRRTGSQRVSPEGSLD